MNELLAILFLVFYPFYFPSKRKPKNTKNDIIEFLKDIELYKEDLYIFFHDEEELQSDLFFIFEALMKKGMSNLFDPKIIKKDDPEYKKYEIFPQMWKDDSDDEKPTYVYRRCALLTKEKLKSLDNDLYSHFKRIDLNCGVFLQRWLRCIFCREFSLEDVYIIWDIILYDDYINEKAQKYSFIYMEYICIAMIFKIRDKLKDADQNDCFTTLFKYPEIKDIMEIIKLSKKVEQAINERLNGKNSNVYDILGIMKPIESEPTRLFSPHIYNQIGSKTNQNTINKINNISENLNKKENSISEKKNIKAIINNDNSNNNNYNDNNKNDENNKDNMAYEQFDEDEKENINLDSMNHNNSNNNNDLSSQAKSFFNNALNSLTNFGGIIKDQLQNAKDTVIDSFTGNNIINDNNNYYNNNYDDNYQQNGNYYDNNYSDNNIRDNNNSNYNNNSNILNININNYNHDNNFVENNNQNEQNDEPKTQNYVERKESIDNENELVYNRQDINDIVNKLKEFDKKYNMFFNDEDKKNFRIIIDYLKAKI